MFYFPREQDNVSEDELQHCSSGMTSRVLVLTQVTHKSRSVTN